MESIIKLESRQKCKQFPTKSVDDDGSSVENTNLWKQPKKKKKKKKKNPALDQMKTGIK